MKLLRGDKTVDDVSQHLGRDCRATQAENDLTFYKKNSLATHNPNILNKLFSKCLGFLCWKITCCNMLCSNFILYYL